jgi:hypothetical protein
VSFPLLLFFSSFAGMVVIKVIRDLRRLQRITFKFNFEQLWPVFGFVNVALFTFVISSVIEPFDCNKRDDGSFVMTHNPSLECFQDSWNARLPLMIFFLILYGIIGPGIIIHNLWKNRKHPGKEPFRSRFLPLTSPYSQSFFYWEIVVMLKRTAFVVSSNFLSSAGASSAVRYMTSVTILFTSLWMEVQSLPFAVKDFNLLSIV